MCIVSGGYFTKGTAHIPIQTNCVANLSDVLGVGLRVKFDMSEATHSYKATMKIDTPSGPVTATTPYIQVISNQVFDLSFYDFGIVPEEGTYSISQFTLRDTSNQVVCTGVGGTGQCETLTIGACVPNWQCEQPLNGYENDSCGHRRLNSACNPLARTITWSGYDWTVKSGTMGPGPNNWSDDPTNVFVDDQGRLHLTITNRSGEWYCTEIISNKTLGYGTYTFNVSPITDLDPNAVFGMFTYLNDTHEIDIEYSQWGNTADSNNCGFTVQPSSGGLTQYNHHRFTVSQPRLTQNSFTWIPANVAFETKTTTTTTTWVVDSANAYIPDSSMEKVRLNLWLYQGTAPQNGLAQEVIIDSFEFTKSPYECKNNTCIPSVCDPTTQTTCYSDLISCQNVCKQSIITYDCKNVSVTNEPKFQCVEVQGSGGQYADLASCQTVCKTTACKTGTINLFGSCVSTSQLIVGGLGLALLLVLLKE